MAHLQAMLELGPDAMIVGHRLAQLVQEVADLPRNRVGYELIATAREVPIDRGPRQAGVGSDVFE